MYAQGDYGLELMLLSSMLGALCSMMMWLSEYSSASTRSPPSNPTDVNLKSSTMGGTVCVYIDMCTDSERQREPQDYLRCVCVGAQDIH
jgi:hypothetical protein